ncbi:MAG: hypothetical protein ACD_2C00225G0004 [uncultured bacterium (gcode 4)]|uniref:Uncharacterized protein n=1 Tax=uncultured bacterium (gcode 4) TaxID=1234023 RepID=K2FDD9_9BACT|nr:MAG: hypothetical protein ACD_2C00225G0004 [uncultured bacterium (gcode 4)]
MNLYSFDLIRFGFKISKSELVQFKIENQLSSLFLIGPKCRKPKKNDKANFHYKSQLIGVPKSAECFKLILAAVSKAKGVLSYIEFSCDTVFSSNEETSDVFSQLLDYVYMAHIRPDYLLLKSSPKRDFFDGRSLIIGIRNNLQFIMYPRFHKTLRLPVLRREFKILGHTNILQAFNLKNESEISDPEFHFRLLEDRYYRTAKLINGRVQSLIKHKKIQRNIERCFEFKNYLAHEKADKSYIKNEKYKQKLAQSFNYYITSFFKCYNFNNYT